MDSESLIASADQRERERMLEAVAHDVRSPLQVLGIALHALRLRSKGREEQELVLSAESAYEEICSVAESLIDALKFGAIADIPQEEGLSLANLFADIERRYGRKAREQSIELRVRSGRIYCVTDRRYLQRILDNLVGNALKHSQAKTVLVGARLRGNEILAIEVRDDGCGIPDEEQSLVFEERYRGRGALQRQSRGQGLGLWIVRRFAQALGGKVFVWSVLGRGTRFTVEVPTYAVRRPPPVARVATGMRELQGRLIALLDDDTENLKAMRICLETFGANVFASEDELRFLARVTTLPAAPDMVLLDFNLGANTSERTLRTLRSRFGEALPVAFLTAYAADPRLRTLAPNTPVLRKPLGEDGLRWIVNQARNGKPSLPTV